MKSTTPKILVIIAAILFWLLIVSGQNYINVVELPLQVYEPRPDKSLGKVLPEKVSVRVEGPGRAIFLQNWIKKASLILDVGTINNLERISLKDYFKNRPNQVLLNEELTFLEVVFPDSIDVLVEDKISKKLPVKVNSNISVKSGYIQVGKELVQEVTVEGPEGLLNKIKSISTKPLLVEDADASLTLQAELINPNPDLLQLDPTVVDVDINIEMIGERVIGGVPITIRNCPQELQIRTIPETVSLQITGGNTQIQSLNAENFKVYFDYLTQWLPNKHYYTPRVITPETVLDLLSISPERVEVVVTGNR